MSTSNIGTLQQGPESSKKSLFDPVRVSPFKATDSIELEVIDYGTLSVLSDQKSANKSFKKTRKPRIKVKNQKESAKNVEGTFTEDHHAVPFDYSTLDSHNNQPLNFKAKKGGSRKDRKTLEVSPENETESANNNSEAAKGNVSGKLPLRRKKKNTVNTIVNDIKPHDVEDLIESVNDIKLNTKTGNNHEQTLPHSHLPKKGNRALMKSKSKKKPQDKFSVIQKDEKIHKDISVPFEKEDSQLAVSKNLSEEKDVMELVSGRERISKAQRKDATTKRRKRAKLESDIKEICQNSGVCDNKTSRKQSGLKNDSSNIQTPKAKVSKKNAIHDSHDQTPTSNSQRRKHKPVYEKYLTSQELSARMKENTVYQGVLRINKRNRLEAYVTSDAFDRDIYICGSRIRNRALEGDTVAVALLEGERLKHIKEQRSRDAQKRGRVLLDELENGMKLLFGEIVYIFERGNGNKYSGTLVAERPNGSTGSVGQKDGKHIKLAWFIPSDRRVPYFIIPLQGIPKDFTENPEAYKHQIVIASIRDWPSNSVFPFGKIVRKIGAVGNVVSETEALLADNNVRTEDFGPQVKQCLPKLPWTIPKSEIKNRRDLRGERVFTIDPSTAKDLDDAVSCRKLPDGNLEIGVHIADVSYFVKPGTALDREAKLRATTVYLVEKAIPMLPNILCQELCSLNPGVDRLAFSVMWKMTPDAKILDVWFGRTVINSCCRLAYEQAQEVILGKPLDPDVTLYGQARDQIESDIKIFYQLSQIMRKRRFENGALSINSIRLCFQLNSDGIPLTCQVYNLKESNRLIEEFMLLANISVAEKISATYPKQAFLRRHAPPLEKRMAEFVKIAEDLGYDINPETAGTLQQSLNSIESVTIQHVLKALCIKPMQRAKYFCTGTLEPDKYRHYALNVPLYTHFTSPIRRYADVVVHRQLQSVLLGKKDFYEPTEKIQAIANHCNTKKEAAKNAQEMSSHIYLAVYLYNLTQSHGPLVRTAIIVDVVENGFDVLVPEFGIEKRIYIEKLPVEHSKWDSKSKTIAIQWKKDTQVSIPQDESNEDSDGLIPDVSLDDICLDIEDNNQDNHADYSHLSNMDHDEFLEDSCDEFAQEMSLDDNIAETAEIIPYSEAGNSPSQLQDAISKPEPSQSQFLDSELNFNVDGDAQIIKVLGHVNVLVTSDITRSPAIINIIAINPLVPIGKNTNST